MHEIGAKCVFASEIDKFARITYEHNFRKINPELFADGYFNEDINDVDLNKIPDFDVMCAGFPCQPFSQAGLKKGFEDTRGTLFFRMAEIIDNKIKKKKPPKVILLENVKGLKGHNKGETLKTILEVLTNFGYLVNYKVLNAKYFGVPQNRERIFIVAWRKNYDSPKVFKFPVGIDNSANPIFDEKLLANCAKKVQVGDVLLASVDQKYTISDRLHNGHLRRLQEHKRKGNGFGFSLFSHHNQYTNTISARYYKDGSEILIKQKNKNPRKLHPKEAALLQGYPIDKGFEIVVSDTQAYKQFGNSVAVPVVKTLAKELLNQIL